VTTFKLDEEPLRPFCTSGARGSEHVPMPSSWVGCAKIEMPEIEHDSHVEFLHISADLICLHERSLFMLTDHVVA
jgi:hypothetical protein